MTDEPTGFDVSASIAIRELLGQVESQQHFINELTEHYRSHHAAILHLGDQVRELQNQAGAHD